MKTEKDKKKRIIVGEVVSDKMDKTVVAKTMRRFKHPLLQKILRRTKKYKVHDETGQAKVGDVIEFYEGRPVSKTKRWYLLRVVKPRSA